MARRNKPYLPLYVQDFLTDEKLIECSAESTGVYIRLMCIMHKSEPYGTILLKQKDKQTPSTIKNFACKLLRQMPYQSEIIERSLQELINENVLTLDGDTLYQKRMVEDKKLSDTKAEAGRKGGNATQTSLHGAKAKPKAPAKAKTVANADNDNDIDIDVEYTELRKKQEELDAVLDAANAAGFPDTSATWDKLNLIVADHGADAVLAAIDICVEANVCNLRYLKGILNKDKQDDKHGVAPGYVG